MTDDLKDRVEQFQRLELPGQLPMMHMGTAYLVSDLWEEVQRLRTENEKLWGWVNADAQKGEHK